MCAVGYDSVTAFARTLPGPPVVVNLEPATLSDIFEDIRRVAAATGVAGRAEGVVASLREARGGGAGARGKGPATATRA